MEVSKTDFLFGYENKRYPRKWNRDAHMLHPHQLLHFPHLKVWNINISVDSFLGYYCRSGVSVSTPEGLPVNATLCPPGTFNYTDAGPCPAGFYCPVGTAEPEKCPPGTFSNETKLSSEEQCTNCTPGHYCENFNLVEPEGLCRKGYYCPSGASKPDMIECPAGAYCIEGTFEPELCPNGTFRNITKGMSINDCFNCTPGYYCQGVGLTKETGACAERYFLLLSLDCLIDLCNGEM